MNSSITSDWFANVLRWLRSAPTEPGDASESSIARFSSDPESTIGFGYQLLAGLKDSPEALAPLQSPPTAETKGFANASISCAETMGQRFNASVSMQQIQVTRQSWMKFQSSPAISIEPFILIRFPMARGCCFKLSLGPEQKKL